MEPAAPVQKSLLKFYFDALGLEFALLLPLAGLAAFLLALVLVIRGRGPMAGVALLLAVSLPMLVGIYAAIDGAIQAYMVIATSPVIPKQSEVAEGWSMALVAPQIGMYFMAPAFLVALVGTTVRTVFGRSESR
jgi:hypothetical protein